MASMRALLDPKAIAVVGASQRRGRGTSVIANLRDCRLQGRDLRGQSALPGRARLQVLSHASTIFRQRSTASWSRSPPRPPARSWSRPMRAAFRAAVVLSAGFGEGGHGDARAARLRSLADRGMAICGPNCFGLINVKTGAAAYQRPARRARCVRARSRWSRKAAASAQFRVRAADARPQARLHPFHLVRQPDRRDGRGLCRVFRRRSRRHGDRRRHRGAEESAQARARGRRGACAAQIAGVLPGRPLGGRPDHDPLPHRRARRQHRSPGAPSCAAAASCRSRATTSSSRPSSCSRTRRATDDGRQRGRAGIRQRRRRRGRRRRARRCRRHARRRSSRRPASASQRSCRNSAA